MIKRLIRSNFLILITILLTIFISSCSKKEPKRLKDDKFVAVLTDLMIIENLSVQESERIQLAQQVFERHHIDSSAFYETQRHYAENEKHWIKIYTRVKQRIQAKLDSIQTGKSLPDTTSSKSD